MAGLIFLWNESAAPPVVDTTDTSDGFGGRKRRGFRVKKPRRRPIVITNVEAFKGAERLLRQTKAIPRKRKLRVKKRRPTQAPVTPLTSAEVDGIARTLESKAEVVLPQEIIDKVDEQVQKLNKEATRKAHIEAEAKRALQREVLILQEMERLDKLDDEENEELILRFF